MSLLVGCRLHFGQHTQREKLKIKYASSLRLPGLYVKSFNLNERSQGSIAGTGFSVERSVSYT